MSKIMLNGIEYAGSGGTGNTTTVELTQAEYDALPSTKLTDSITYYITDGNNPNVVTASQVMYDNSDSELEATNVQGAIDNVADIITPFGFDKLKTQTFTGLTVPANFIDTRDLTLSVPAELGILSGFALAGTSNCSVIQCYFTNRTTLHTRILNLASQQDSYSFVVFYI